MKKSGWRRCMENDDFYDLDTLIEKLQEIKENETGFLSFAKAFYCLAKEIQRINYYIDFLNKCIPHKYKKIFPKDGENPFFEVDNLELDSLGLKNPQERKDCLARMKEYEKKHIPKEYPRPIAEEGSSTS